MLLKILRLAYVISYSFDDHAQDDMPFTGLINSSVDLVLFF